MNWVIAGMVAVIGEKREVHKAFEEWGQYGEMNREHKTHEKEHSNMILQ